LSKSFEELWGSNPHLFSKASVFGGDTLPKKKTTNSTHGGGFCFNPYYLLFSHHQKFLKIALDPYTGFLVSLGVS